MRRRRRRTFRARRVDVDRDAARDRRRRSRRDRRAPRRAAVRLRRARGAAGRRADRAPDRRAARRRALLQQAAVSWNGSRRRTAARSCWRTRTSHGGGTSRGTVRSRRVRASWTDRTCPSTCSREVYAAAGRATMPDVIPCGYPSRARRMPTTATAACTCLPAELVAPLRTASAAPRALAPRPSRSSSAAPRARRPGVVRARDARPRRTDRPAAGGAEFPDAPGAAPLRRRVRRARRASPSRPARRARRRRPHRAAASGRAASMRVNAVLSRRRAEATAHILF